jgi:type VI secretion system secreted protein VgrG
MADPNSPNLYVYCGNNPLVRIDPTGESWDDVKEWVSNAWDTVKSWFSGGGNSGGSSGGSTSTSGSGDFSRASSGTPNHTQDGVGQSSKTGTPPDPEPELPKDGPTTPESPIPKDNFDEIIGHVLNIEGGYVDHPDDKGGPTNRGITFNTFKRVAKEHLGIDPTLENLKNLSVEQAKTIYRKMYWEPMGGSKIKDKQVAHIMFDMAVNSGVKTSVTTMQKTLIKMEKTLVPDGIIGPKTLNAINTTNSEDLFNNYKTARINYYKAINR